MFRRTAAAGDGASEDLARRVGVRLADRGREVTLPGVEAVLRELVAEADLGWDRARLRRTAHRITDELTGLGPVGPLLRDAGVTEIMVNAPGEVFVERRGRLERAAVAFGSDTEILHLIEQVVSRVGLRVDPSSPWVDARLPDGSRFHAVVPPVALRGPTVTIRKFGAERWTLTDLVRQDSIDEAAAVRLREAVRERRNVLVSGGAGTGKTTLLGILARLVPRSERLITIEDAAELRLGNRHVVALECRPPNVEGRGEVSMRDLVRCAMRMRPDRIVVGEVRGPEALDMLQALNSGHAGSMATVHANAPEEALLRIETMALMAAPGLSIAAARRQVASAIELVVHLVREADGHRRVREVAEVMLSDEGPVVRRLRRQRMRNGSSPAAKARTP